MCKIAKNLKIYFVTRSSINHVVTFLGILGNMSKNLLKILSKNLSTNVSKNLSPKFFKKICQKICQKMCLKICLKNQTMNVQLIRSYITCKISCLKTNLVCRRNLYVDGAHFPRKRCCFRESKFKFISKFGDQPGEL